MPGFQGRSGFKGGMQPPMPTPRPPMTGGQVGGIGPPPGVGKSPGAAPMGGGGWGPAPGQTPPWMNPKGGKPRGPGKPLTKPPVRPPAQPAVTSKVASATPAAPTTAMPYDYIPGYMPPSAPGGNSLTGGPEVPMPPPVASGPPPGTPQVSTPYTPPVATPASGAQVHHDMGSGANYGQTRVDPATGQQQMWANMGGGGQYGWVNWDPRMQQVADMYSRYGNNWYSGSGATSMHTADIAQVLREQMGREPTLFEINDVYYGMNRNVPGIAYNPR